MRKKCFLFFENGKGKREKGKGVFRRPRGRFFWAVCLREFGGEAMRRKKEREKRLEGVDGYWDKTASGSSGSEVGLKRCMLHQ